MAAEIQPQRRRTMIAAAATIAGIIIRGASSLITVRLCFAFIGKEAFALWVFIQNASGYFSLSEAGVGQSVLNEQGKAFEKKDDSEMSRILVSATGLYVGLVTFAATIAIGVLFFVPLRNWLPEDLSVSLVDQVAPLLAISIALVLCAVPLTSFGATLSGARFHHVRQVLDAGLPLFVLTTLTLVFLAGGGLKSAVVITPLSQIVWGAVYFIALKKYLPSISLHPKHFSTRLAKTMLGHSMFFFLIGFCLLGFRALPSLMVGRHGSIDDVTRVYSLVLLIRVLGWSLMDAASRVVQPYIIMFEQQGKPERIQFFTRLGVAITSFGALILSLGVLCFGERILEVWLHDTTPLARGVIECLCFSFLFDIALLPVYNTLVALNRHRRLGIMMAVQSALMIVASEGFVHAGVSTNPTVSVLAGIVFASFLTFILAGPIVAGPGMRMSLATFASSILARPLVCILIALVVTALISVLPDAIAIRTGVFTVSAVAALLLAWTFILSREERDFLQSLIPRL